MKNTAQKIAAMYNNDGQTFTTSSGTHLLDAIKEHRAAHDFQDGTDRYEFSDESVILINGDCWDIESKTTYFLMTCEE